MMRVAIFALLLGGALAEVCKDQLSTAYCRELEPQGFCQKNRNFKAMCKLTCGVCTEPSTVAPATRPVPSDADATRDDDDCSHDDDDDDDDDDSKLGPPPACGMSTVPLGRVIAGETAKLGAWPWQIAMFIGSGFACGGSLVTPEWVITAAHCVQRYNTPAYYTIRLGATDLTKTETAAENRKVVRIISHPNYGNLNYDLALMQLDRPVILSDKIRIVCVPKETDVVPVGTKCFITGWGKVRHPGYSHNVLQQADLPIVDSKTCSELNSRVLNVPISNQMVCAGHGPYNPKGGCHGDSGGPLVCQTGQNNAFTLHGAVSWGSPRCHTGDAYTVFARISSFRKWIEQYIPL